MKNIWNWLNGNKTIICTFIVALLSQSFIAEMFKNAELLTFLIWLFSGLAAGSFIHHVKKGSFKSDTK